MQQKEAQARFDTLAQHLLEAEAAWVCALDEGSEDQCEAALSHLDKLVELAGALHDDVDHLYHQRFHPGVSCYPRFATAPRSSVPAPGLAYHSNRLATPVNGPPEAGKRQPWRQPEPNLDCHSNASA